MNIIERQAIDFIRDNLPESGDYNEFIGVIRKTLNDYHRLSYKIEYLESIIANTRIEYEKHSSTCKTFDCKTILYYENVLFFLLEELEELNSNISSNDFTKIEKESISEKLNQIISNQNLIKLGQEITYDDFKLEFDELKNYYFLNKKNWSQLFLGKLTEMVAGGIISETVSKNIVEILKINYNNLIK